MKDEKIDFVILWVDGNDLIWQNEKSKYENALINKIVNSNIDNTNVRYRDWENLKYWFRGVEKFAPWVNRIHFITYGHLPKWLNINNPKLNIVKHSDYLPKDALPTFNSNAIELMIHKIEELEEQFVLFNDDTFIIKDVKKKDFFKNSKPSNTMSLLPIIPVPDGKMYKTISNNIAIINKHFNLNDCLKKNLFKFLSLKQGKYISKTYPCIIYNKFVGFANFHLPVSYLKSTFEEVWNKEYNNLIKTVYSRFRDYDNNVNHWLFNYWQFATGNFNQRNVNFGKNMLINDDKVSNFIVNQKYKIIGLSDIETIEDFSILKTRVINDFETILPKKSSYEL